MRSTSSHSQQRLFRGEVTHTGECPKYGHSPHRFEIPQSGIMEVSVGRISKEEVYSDDDLVERIRLGDEKAAEELIKRYYTSVLLYCKNHCFGQEKAEDLTQETFLKLFKNLSGYKGKRKFKAYLFTIANHLCIDESRKVEVYSLENEEEIRDTSDKMRQIEEKAEIEYLLKVLSPEQREAVVLRFREELSFWEIAKVMGCNMRTAQSRVRNALKIMRKEQENGR